MDELRSTCAVSGEIDHIVSLHEMSILQRRLQVEHSVTDEGVLVGVGGLFELSVTTSTSASGLRLKGVNVPKSANLNFFGPHLAVQLT